MEQTVYTGRAKKAYDYFCEGYNCAQAVVLAFADLTDFEPAALAGMISPFGGGMGRMREVCGAFSGCNMVLGLLRGYHSPDARQEKIDLYAEVRELADQFRAANGSIICRELLTGVPHTEGGVPEERTASYYKKRPCKDIVATAAQLLEEHLREKGVKGV